MPTLKPAATNFHFPSLHLHESITVMQGSDLQWALKLLPPGDRFAVALGHYALFWVLWAHLKAEKDGPFAEVSHYNKHAGVGPAQVRVHGFAVWIGL